MQPGWQVLAPRLTGSSWELPALNYKQALLWSTSRWQTPRQGQSFMQINPLPNKQSEAKA